MSKRLTAAAVERLRAKSKRQEIGDAGSQGLRLIIQPSGAKSWAMRFRRPDGRNAKLTLGSVDLSGREGGDAPRIGQPLTLREARLLASDVHRRRAAGEDVTARKGEAGDDAFAKVAAAFLRDYQREKRNWRDVAKALGLDAELQVIPGSLADRWGRRPVGSITTGDVHAVIAESIGRGVPGIPSKSSKPSDSRGRKMGDALGSLFRWASRHRRHAIQVNPMAGVWRPGPPASRHRVLNVRPEVRRGDEARWLWRATEEVGNPFGALVRLLILTGARRDEIADLRWSEVADDLSTVHLPGSRTKNGKPHIIYLSPLAQDVLRGVQRVEGSPYVFTTNGRVPFAGFSKVKRQLDGIMLRLAQEEGVDRVEPWTLHDLRRSCATGMAGIGILPHIVEVCLGHTSGAIGGVAGIYNRAAYAPERKAAAAAWGSHIAGLVAENVVHLRQSQ